MARAAHSLAGGGPRAAVLELMAPGHLRDLTAVREIGGHTRNHVLLPPLGFGSLREEIAGTRRELQALTGGPVVTFAYPYGGWSPAIEGVLEEEGYETAWTTLPGHLNGAHALR